MIDGGVPLQVTSQPRVFSGDPKMSSKDPTGRKELKLDISQSKLIEKPQTPQVKNVHAATLLSSFSVLSRPDRSSLGGINRGRLTCDDLTHRQ